MEATKLGKYDIRAELGRGAMGTVYEAWDPAVERKVAIKTVNLPAGNAEAKATLARHRRPVVCIIPTSSRCSTTAKAKDSLRSSWNSSRGNHIGSNEGSMPVTLNWLTP